MVDSQHRILKLNAAGRPVDWLTWQEAVREFATESVVWSHGNSLIKVRGGRNRYSGLTTTMELPPVISVKGYVHRKYMDDSLFIPRLTNELLFRRDSYICMYCGVKFKREDLSRDHVHPVSKGGQDVWTNVVSACKSCNSRKADRTPEGARMELLAVPFKPNIAETLFLSNRHIVTDQMSFLKKGFSRNSSFLV